MKLIVQIPCLNEADTLPATLREIPRAIPGVDSVEILVVDDGSTDATVAIARSLGVDHVVRHVGNRGLATAFQTGINACLQAGADIIVNTDGDNQYPARYIPALIEPIIRGEADIVVADRQTGTVEEFSWTKRVLQKIGSAVVRLASGTTLPDAPSGFRALSREAALRLNVLTGYTYTLETIIQAGRKNLVVTHVPIRTNPKTRPSRLIPDMKVYVARSAGTILRLVVLYQPLRVFAWLSVPFFVIGGLLWIRFLWLLVTLGTGTQGRFLQSVVAGATLLIIGFLVMLFGVLADLVATNRRLQEENLYFLRRLALDPASARSFGSAAPTAASVRGEENRNV